MEQAVDAARAPAATLAYGAHRAASLSPAPSLQAALPGGAAVEPVIFFNNSALQNRRTETSVTVTA